MMSMVAMRMAVLEVTSFQQRVEGQRFGDWSNESVYWPLPDCKQEMTSLRVSKQVKIRLGTILDESHCFDVQSD